MRKNDACCWIFEVVNDLLSTEQSEHVESTVTLKGHAEFENYY